MISGPSNEKRIILLQRDRQTRISLLFSRNASLLLRPDTGKLIMSVGVVLHATLSMTLKEDLFLR